jgi:hypothetical protein
MTRTTTTNHHNRLPAAPKPTKMHISGDQQQKPRPELSESCGLGIDCPGCNPENDEKMMRK